MKKKIFTYLLLTLTVFSLVGCNKNTNEEIEDTEEIEEYTYQEGFPELDIVKNIPTIEEGDIIYYEYETSITIYVTNITEEYAINYIKSLKDYGWTSNYEEDEETYFDGYNEENQYLYVDYSSEELSITIYNE